MVVISNKAKIDLWWSFGKQVSSDLFLSFGGGSSGKYEKAIHTKHNLRTNRSYKMNFMINLLYDHICAVHWEKYERTLSKE